VAFTMNANQLWSGNDYAYSPNRGRGQSFIHGAERIRVIRTFQERDNDSRRARTMVEGLFISNATGKPRKAYSGDDLKRNVRARDIFMRWDEYEDEERYRDEQAEKIEQERRERQQKDQDSKTRILEALEAKGIERTAVSSINDYGITISRHVIESWLGLDAQ
jgi:hypothetical protein